VWRGQSPPLFRMSLSSPPSAFPPNKPHFHFQLFQPSITGTDTREISAEVGSEAIIEITTHEGEMDKSDIFCFLSGSAIRPSSRIQGTKVKEQTSNKKLSKKGVKTSTFRVVFRFPKKIVSGKEKLDIWIVRQGVIKDIVVARFGTFILKEHDEAELLDAVQKLDLS
jgi:hypothetical protein